MSFDLPIASDTYRDGGAFQFNFASDQSGESSIFLIGLSTTLAKIGSLRLLNDDWDGMGSNAPSDEQIACANAWTAQFKRVIDSDWKPPHVSASEDGDVTFEWWNGEKKLTIYIRATRPEYIIAWGADIDNEMSDGVIATGGQFNEMWRWLRA